MFKDNEILQHLHSTEATLTKFGLVLASLNDRLSILSEKVEYLAAAEEARATHSKKPTRKGKVEEVTTNG